MYIYTSKRIVEKNERFEIYNYFFHYLMIHNGNKSICHVNNFVHKFIVDLDLIVAFVITA